MPIVEVCEAVQTWVSCGLFLSQGFRRNTKTDLYSSSLPGRTSNIRVHHPGEVPNVINPEFCGLI
jgi:hypothetical protein